MYKWKDQNKPWASMRVKQIETEDDLFCACTTIFVANGESVKFGYDRWLHGQRPKELALTLYRLAWRKNITVAEGFIVRKWMKGLQQISTTEEINQFTILWNMLRHIQLSDQADEITWTVHT
jgi:hypothetical protein